MRAMRGSSSIFFDGGRRNDLPFFPFFPLLPFPLPALLFLASFASFCRLGVLESMVARLGRPGSICLYEECSALMLSSLGERKIGERKIGVEMGIERQR